MIYTTYHFIACEIFEIAFWNILLLVFVKLFLSYVEEPDQG